MPKSPVKIVVLISGGGTTLKNLIQKRAEGQLNADIVHVVSSRPDAGGIAHAQVANLNVTVVHHRDFDSIESFSETIFDLCRQHHAELVVLGGFLRRIQIPDDFENRVINIHPSLMPDFAGKGFYGIRVHRAVIESGKTESGCTVHVVDDEYDHGPIIAQEKVAVQPDDTPETLAARVFEAECRLLPEVINMLAE